MLGTDELWKGAGDVTNTYGRKKGADLYYSQTCEETGGLCSLYAVRSSSAPWWRWDCESVGFVRGTHIEADNAIQISEGLDDNLPHVEVGALEKLLHGNLFTVLRLDLELWSKSITSPEASPACSAERHNTD